jgi:hypothetical protein
MIVQEQISDTQANTRAAAELIARAARMAGYNIPTSMDAVESYDTNPDTIVITYDSGSLERVELEQSMSNIYSELRCDGHDLSALHDNEWAYIYDRSADVGEFFLVSEVQYGSSYIQHTSMPLSRVYPAGSEVIKLNRLRFFVDQTNADHPNLMIQSYGSAPAVFAENIIALNFRYFMENGSVVTQTNTPELVRMIEIDVLGRTDAPDDEFPTNYRTRNFTLRVKVRNLDL